MKIKGQTLGEPEPRVVVFTRGDKDFVLRVKAVYDYREFDKLCPEPTPRVSMNTGPIVDDAYKQRIKDHYANKTNWVIITALSATEGLEWDEVDFTKPETWCKYEDELRASGMTTGELSYLIDEIGKANSVDEKVMEAARDRFTRSQEAAE